MTANETPPCRRADCRVPSIIADGYCSVGCILADTDPALLTARLEAIRQLAEAALADRDAMPLAIAGEAINWGDLHPADVRFCISRHGYVTYMIDVDEASPEAAGLQQWVRSRIVDALPDLNGEVEVRTEW